MSKKKNEWTIDEEFDESKNRLLVKKKYPKLSYPSICKILRKGQS